MRLSLCCGLLLLAVPALPAGDDFKLEPGFTLLFDGKDLTGWKTKEGDDLKGKADAYGGRFKVADGVLTIDEKVKGDKYLYTIKEFDKDVHIKFDYKPNKGCNNDLFFRKVKFDIVPGKLVKNAKVDEWNTFEIIVKGENIEYRSNGEVMRSNKAKPAPSNFGLRAEFGTVQYRRIRIKEGS